MITPQQPQQPQQPPSWPRGPYGPPVRQPFHPPKQSPRVKAWLTHGAVAFVALIVGAGIGGSGETEAGTDAKAGAGRSEPATTLSKAAEAVPTPAVTEAVTAKPEPSKKPEPPKKTEKPGPAATFAGEGEYLVGTDVKTGTYKTAGSDSAFGCYWARLENASGEFDAIIANNNLKGPGHVTLNKGEYFETNGCEEWKKVG